MNDLNPKKNQMKKIHHHFVILFLTTNRLDLIKYLHTIDIKHHY